MSNVAVNLTPNPASIFAASQWAAMRLLLGRLKSRYRSGLFAVVSRPSVVDASDGIFRPDRPLELQALIKLFSLLLVTLA